MDALIGDIAKVFFGSITRVIGTIFIGGIFALKFFPTQAGPIVPQLWAVVISLIGIRVMLIPFWPIKKARKKKG